MNTTESNNLLEVWDKLCELIDQRGSVVHLDSNTKSSEQVKFNQIKLNRKSALWQSMLEVLAPLSEEEIAVLLDLAKPNNTHTVYQSKVSIALFISIPLGLLYLINLIIQNFNLGEGNFLPDPAIGGLIGGSVVILFLGGYLLYKQLAYRWLSMELSTCLEMALAMKKAERINFKKYALAQTKDKKSKITLKKTAIKIDAQDKK